MAPLMRWVWAPIVPVDTMRFHGSIQAVVAPALHLQAAITVPHDPWPVT